MQIVTSALGRVVLFAAASCAATGPLAAEKLETYYAIVRVEPIGDGNCKPRYVSEPFEVQWPVRSGKRDYDFRRNLPLEHSAIMYQFLDHVYRNNPGMVEAMAHPFRDSTGGIDFIDQIYVNEFPNEEWMNSAIEANRFYEPGRICTGPNAVGKQTVTRVSMEGFVHKRPIDDANAPNRLGISAERQRMLHDLLDSGEN